MRTLIKSLFLVVAVTGCNQSAPQPTVSVPPNGNAPVVTANPARTTPAPDRVASERAAPDNTAVNQRDRDANTKTPIDQNENQADISMTAKIRREVLEVKDLSIDARNAKIITADGKVTLRGPVQSAQERETLARIATAVAGAGNVDNQLEVAATGTPNNLR